MGRLLIRPDADADIDAIAQFIADDNLDAGRRFYDAVAHDLLLLADNPRMGARRRSANPKLKQLRSCPCGASATISCSTLLWTTASTCSASPTARET